jgi:PAS domain S-box-containing protein
MGIFIEYDSNLPTSLWIATRYFQATTYILGMVLINKKVNSNYLVVGYLVTTVVLTLLIFSGFFPICYIEGSGLTPFKIISEYIIDLILLSCVILMFRYKEEFERKIFYLIIGSIVATIIAELAFTFYVSVYGFSNLIGHLFKIISFFLLYVSIIQIGVEDPFDLLFRKLKQSEEHLSIKAKDLEIAYSESEQIFNASLPLRIVNSECEIINANDTYCQLFHVGKEDILGKKCFDIIPHDYCFTDLCSQKQIEQGESFAKYEINHERPDGELLTLIVNTVPYKSNSGELLGIIQNYLDITDRKKAEDRLEQFASTVSHELRTPLTVLIMSIDYLKKQREAINNEVEAQLIDSISRNILLLQELIEDILTLSRIDDNKVLLERNEFLLNDIIHDILNLMEPRIKEKRIKINMDHDPKISLIGDKKRIDQIFRILIDNAIKYSNEGSEIQLVAIHNYKGNFNSTNSDGFFFQVIDNGRGIPDKDLPRIFERFYRAENARDVNGSGLGLAIAKQLIELHDGEIFVESEVSIGSTFSVFLPKHQKS